jgi:beta-lactamase superfamily II metal-dependent hydrolase
MFRIEMLPAAHGDALWIEYGGSRPRRILIDAGPINTYDAVFRRLKSATKNRADIELFVITHIDTDHIDGAVVLLRDSALTLEFGDIWFNAWQQLAAEPAGDVYGPLQGEFVQALINMKGRKWNHAFQGGAIVIPESGSLPVAQLADGVKITILSPGDRQLRRLRRNWDSVVTDAGWKPGDAAASLERLEQRREYAPSVRQDVFGDGDGFGTDNAVANGSSIAFVMEQGSIRCLFTGDAFAPVLAESLDRYASAAGITGRIPFDVVKLPHHGSKNNWSADLQKRLTSKHYLVSSNGAKFKHPDRETIDLIIDAEKSYAAEQRAAGRKINLWFNYLSDFTRHWSSPRASDPWQSHYPPAVTAANPAPSIVIEL